jgi:hypothetical protein
MHGSHASTFLAPCSPKNVFRSLFSAREHNAEHLAELGAFSDDPIMSLQAIVGHSSLGNLLVRTEQAQDVQSLGNVGHLHFMTFASISDSPTHQNQARIRMCSFFDSIVCAECTALPSAGAMQLQSSAL